MKILKCNKIQPFCGSGSGTIVLWRESEYPSNPDTSENCFNTNSADTFIWKTGLVIFCQYSIFGWNTAKTITWRGKYRRVWFYANNWKGQLPLCISEITYLFPFPKTLKEKCAQNQVLFFQSATQCRTFLQKQTWVNFWKWDDLLQWPVWKGRPRLGKSATILHRSWSADLLKTKCTQGVSGKQSEKHRSQFKKVMVDSIIDIMDDNVMENRLGLRENIMMTNAWLLIGRVLVLAHF